VRRYSRIVNNFTSYYAEEIQEESKISADVETPVHALIGSLLNPRPVHTSLGGNRGSRLCQQDGCNTQSSYNDECEETGRLCGTHKQPGMVSVYSKHCEHDGCNTRSNYNDEGERGGQFCAAHKLWGMVDVINKH
jgi:hypothetical protein